MIGAIVGDIAGSVYEFDNIKTKDFNLFADYHGHSCSFTDETVVQLVRKNPDMTVSVTLNLEDVDLAASDSGAFCSSTLPS